VLIEEGTAKRETPKAAEIGQIANDRCGMVSFLIGKDGKIGDEILIRGPDDFGD
jgi:hypothetical protein